MNDYIQLTNISKTFGKQTVLQPLTMGFEEGMIHGIIGRNGSGKTVLMKMILGILHPTTGTVIVGDKRIGKDVDFPESAGAIIETIEFIPYMSAYQNLADIAAMRGNLSKTQIKEVLEMVGLGNVGGKHVSKFSMGMRQRLAIAQAVMESPKLLILDEPTAGLDPKERVKFRNLISSFAENKIVILSTHIVTDVEYIADEILVIKGGALLKKGAESTIIQEISGKVWECRVTRQEAERLENRFTVCNSKTENGEAVLRIVSDSKPCDTAVSVSPCLEDLYLYYFHGEV